MICEHCSNDIEGIHVAHSAVAVLQKVTPAGYMFYQCEDGQEFNYVTYQHFACDRDHMRNLYQQCVQEHYSEQLLHSIPPGAGTTILHRIVLDRGLTCKVCATPLVHMAYRFCLTVSTPVNFVPDNSLDEQGEWCCSLEHARQSALEIISRL